MEDDEGNAIEHNFRAPQPLNDRKIYNMGKVSQNDNVLENLQFQVVILWILPKN